MKRLVPLALIVPLAAAACSSSSKTTNGTSSTTGSSSTTAATQTVDMKLANPASAQTVNEAGSSLLFPYLQVIAPGIKTAYPNVTLSPAPGGSGAGINDAIAGTTQLGGSDAYLSPTNFSSNPGLLNIPIAVSSQSVDYNLKGITNLKLNGDVLAKMYTGQITKWNDPAVASLNPGVTLPDTAVVPVHRSDSSGDTFLFTSFLSKTNTAWSSSPGYNTSITWPNVSSAQTASGNPGMVQTCSATPGCVAYVGISAQSSADAAGLGQAELQNVAGNFELPSSSTVTAAVDAGSGGIPANLAVSLIYQPGANSYPIVNFEYIVVKSTQASADMAQAIRDVLGYAIDTNGGSSADNLAKDQFEALPTGVLSKVQSAIASIQ